MIAAAGTCFGTRNNALSSHQDLTHTRTLKDRQTRTLKTTWPCKKFLWESRQNFHTSTNAKQCKAVQISAKHRQDLNARTSWGGFHQDLCKSFSRGIHKRSWNSQAGSCTDTETRSMHICVRFRVRRHTLDRARASQKSSPGALKDFHKTATRLYFCQG